MKPISLLEIAAILGAGCVGGVFFAFSSFVMPALDRLEGAHGMLAMKQINTSVLSSSFIAVLMGTGGLMLALLYFQPSLKDAAGRCVVAACLIYLIGAIGVTTLANVPLNVRLHDSDVGDLSTWKAYVRDWTTWNSIRGLAAILSSIMLMLAMVLGRVPLRS